MRLFHNNSSTNKQKKTIKLKKNAKQKYFQWLCLAQIIFFCSFSVHVIIIITTIIIRHFILLLQL